jgi:type I restriction enzyme S subunit
MNPQLLLAYFARISEAPDAVSRLRRFILDLSVRGRLVEQNSNDEPASEILKRINAEKTRLAKAGIIKKLDSIALPTDPKFSFPMPSGWAASTLQSLCISVTDGDHIPPPKADQGVPFLVIGNVRSQTLNFAGCRHVSEQYYKALDAIRRPQKGDILYTLVGSYGIPVMITDERQFCVQRHIGILRPSPSINARFLSRALESKWVFDQATACATGIAQKTVPLAGLRQILIPLPPLSEQHRIVAKVDELMALCDRLEAAQGERETRRVRLAAASHHYLNNGVNAEDLPAHAHFSINHLSTITTRPEHIPALRRTILSLAVRGQLVSQNPTDESVSELLTRIQAEKARLIKEGILRKEKPLAAVANDEVPFAVPTTWRWARIGTCSLLTEYGTSVKSDQVADGVPVLAMGNIQDGRVVLNDRRKVPHCIDDLPHLYLKRFDLLYNRTNSAELVGKTGIYLGDDDAYTFASYLIRIRFLNNLTSPVYANLAMNAPYFRATQIVPELQQQCGQANVNGSKLRNMMIPLPPLAEQHRIIAKVDELMRLCDQLETQLSTMQNEKQSLLEAVLNDALDSGDGAPELKRLLVEA